MDIRCSRDEAWAIMEIQKMFREAGTPVPFFLNWVADRLVSFGDNPNVDFVVTLRHRATQLEEIAKLLGEAR